MSLTVNVQQSLTKVRKFKAGIFHQFPCVQVRVAHESPERELATRPLGVGPLHFRGTRLIVPLEAGHSVPPLDPVVRQAVREDVQFIRKNVVTDNDVRIELLDFCTNQVEERFLVLDLDT